MVRIEYFTAEQNAVLASLVQENSVPAFNRESAALPKATPATEISIQAETASARATAEAQNQVPCLLAVGSSHREDAIR